MNFTTELLYLAIHALYHQKLDSSQIYPEKKSLMQLLPTYQVPPITRCGKPSHPFAARFASKDIPWISLRQLHEKFLEGNSQLRILRRVHSPCVTQKKVVLTTSHVKRSLIRLVMRVTTLTDRGNTHTCTAPEFNKAPNATGLVSWIFPNFIRLRIICLH